MWGQQTCAFEPVVLQTPPATEPKAEVRAHLAACPRCRQAVAARDWMQRMAETTGEFRALPDVGLLWWRAQLVRRWRREREATAPVEAMERVELVIGIAALIALVVWQGPRLWALVTGAAMSWDTLAFTQWVTAAEGSVAVTLVPMVTALLAVATLVTVTRLMITD